MEYLVPSGFGEGEFTEKRSRFIGRVWPVASEEEARGLAARMKSEYYDARHNCWCCIIHEGGILRYSDDGEPQGTAGQPMLEVFHRSGVENVCCVVTRYFGGVLLGAGGLARAYARAAKLALDAAGVSAMRLWKRMELICPYSLFERVKQEMEAFDGIPEQTDYGADVTIRALFPESRADAFRSRLTDLTSGTVWADEAGETYMAAPLRP